MNVIYSILYHPKINWFIRNLCYYFRWLIPKNMRIHPSGTIKFKLDALTQEIKFKTNQTNYLTKILFWERKRGFEYTSIFIELIKDLDVFIDVGANIGYYSILGAKMNPNLKVFSFEPSIGSMIYLSENIKINDLENQISVEVKALSDQVGNVEFNELRNTKYPTIYNLSGEHNIGTKPEKIHHKISVQSDTLNNYFSKKIINKIDLIKLDTEGNEDIILYHSDKVIEKYRPIIICETLFNTIENSLEKIMLQHNYIFFNHIDNRLVKVSSIEREIDNGVRNCFFVPKEKKYLIDKFL